MLTNYDSMGKTNYDTLDGIFNMIKDGEMCMSKTSENKLTVWWNPEYIEEELQKVEITTPGCS